MTKVCILFLNANSAFYEKSSSPVGGAQIQLMHIARVLIDSGRYSVTMVTGDWDQKKISEYHGIKIIYSTPLRMPGIYYPMAFLEFFVLSGNRMRIYF